MSTEQDRVEIQLDEHIKNEEARDSIEIRDFQNRNALKQDNNDVVITFTHLEHKAEESNSAHRTNIIQDFPSNNTLDEQQFPAENNHPNQSPINITSQNLSYDLSPQNAEGLTKFKRIMAVLVNILLSSYFIPNITTDSSHAGIFIIVYSSLGLFLADLILKVFQRHTYSWQKIEEIFHVLDTLTLLVFVVLLNLNLSNHFQMTKLILIPSLACVFLYKLASAAPDAIKEAEVSSKIFFSIQLFLLTIKLDGDVDCSWGIIFCLVWFYLAMIIFYFILLVVIFLMITVFSVLRRRVYESLDCKTQFIGHFWYTLYVGFSAIAFLALTEITTILQGDQDSQFLKKWIVAARYLSLFLIIYGAFWKEKILSYLNNVINYEEETSAFERFDEEKVVMEVKTTKRVYYFQKVSSTYFTPIENPQEIAQNKTEEKEKQDLNSSFGRQNQNQEEGYNSCYVCFENPCNAIVMNCGHGGVCFECALKFIKRKSQCMECRQSSNRLLKIDPNSNKSDDIIKSIEETNIIFE